MNVHTQKLLNLLDHVTIMENEFKQRTGRPRLRPFINRSRQELMAVAEASWNDPEILEAIHAELRLRGTVGAQRLREKIGWRLGEISLESLSWPDTAVLPYRRALSGNQFWYCDGLLSFMGYHVGTNGISSGCRRQILDYIFNCDIPRVKNDAYMQKWNEPQTPFRLMSLAAELAVFASRQTRLADMRFAISQWKEDLQYLKITYYDGRYNSTFPWPSDSPGPSAK